MQSLLRNGFGFYRLYYNIFSLTTLLLIIWWQIHVPSEDVFNRSTLPGAVGLTLAVAGAVIMFVCIKKYFLSMSGLQTLVKEETSIAGTNELMISGIHQYVRHPLYAGTFLFIWGVWLIIPTLSFLIAVVTITVYTLIGIQLEEQKLVTVFGNNYKQYQRSVPMLIPRLW